MEDAAIIALYWERNETAIGESSAKYGPFCRAVALNILSVREDAEECVNDTWLRAWNAIPPARPSPLRAFFGKITRNLSLDRFRAARAQKRGSGNMELILEELGECVGSGGSVEDTFDAQETAGVITRFLEEQQPLQRQLFMRRYWFGDGIAEIAKRFALREGTVKSNLFRTRERLREALEREGVAL